MKTTFVRTLLALAAVSAAGLFPAGGSAASEPWAQAYYYRFEPAAGAGGPSALRVDYVRGERVLYRVQASVSDVAQPLILVLPDPAAEAGTRGTKGVRVVAYAGDAVVAAFDVRGFANYNRRLRAQDGEALAQVFAAQSGTSASAQPAKAGVSTSPMSTAAAQGNTPCTDACLSAYYRCMMSCSYPVNTCSRCAPEHDSCKRNCPVVDIDFDGDGLLGSVDNCPTTYNPDQANCDGDATGDACDASTAIYQAGPEKTCYIDIDYHIVYATAEHVVEWADRDISGCNLAPAEIWHRRMRADANCYGGFGPENCCRQLEDSIHAVGDTVDPWCTTKLQQDFCHVQ